MENVVREVEVDRSLNVQRMLADERERSEQHRNNYLILKEENARLQSEYLNLQKEMKNVLKECKESKDINQSALEEASRAIRQKDAEFQSYQEKVRLESADIERKVGEQVRKKLEELDQEMDRIQEECNQLRRHNLTLTSRLDAVYVSRNISLQDTAVKHQAELRLLRDSLESLQLKQAEAAEEWDKQYHATQRECGHWKALASQLGLELEETRSQKELASQRDLDSKREHDRELGRLQRLVRSLEMERESLSSQKQELQKELTEARDGLRVVQGELREALEERLGLRGALEEERHRHQVESTQLQLEGKRLRATITEATAEAQRLRVRVQEVDLLKKDCLQLTSERDGMVESLKSRVESEAMLRREVHTLVQEIKESQRRRTWLEGEIARLGAVEKETVQLPSAETSALEERLDDLRKELKASRDNEARGQDLVAEGQRSNLNLQGRVAELEGELRQARSQAADQLQLVQKKLSKYRKLIGKLRDKVHAAEIEAEETRCQKELLGKNVPRETYAALGRQLKDLQRRHAHFGQVIAGHTPHLHLLFGSDVIPTKDDGPESSDSHVSAV